MRINNNINKDRKRILRDITKLKDEMKLVEEIETPELKLLKIKFEAEDNNTKYVQMFIGFLSLFIVSVIGYFIKELVDLLKGPSMLQGYFGLLYMGLIVIGFSILMYIKFLKTSSKIYRMKEIIKLTIDDRSDFNKPDSNTTS